MQSVDAGKLRILLNRLAKASQDEVNLKRKLENPKITKKETRICQLWILQNWSIPRLRDEINNIG